MPGELLQLRELKDLAPQLPAAREEKFNPDEPVYFAPCECRSSPRVAYC